MLLQLSSMLAGLMPLSVPVSVGMIKVVLLVVENRANGRRQVALPGGIVLAASYEHSRIPQCAPFGSINSLRR